MKNNSFIFIGSRWVALGVLFLAIGQLSTTMATAATVTLVAQGADWKYLDTGSDEGTAWRDSAFDDSAWSEGPAELGYGDGDEATVVSYGGNNNNKHITTYFRHSFSVSDPADYSSLSLWLLRDDGAVVYLNGVEVFRTSNLPAAPTVITFGTLAGNQGDNVVDIAPLDASGLISGLNLLAVEIHQQAANSSDISFDLELTAEEQPITLNLVSPLEQAVDVNIPATLQAQVIDLSGDNLTVTFYGGEVVPPPPPGPDFTLIALPDTQYYVSSLNGGNPSVFVSQTDWIVANRASMNVAFVTHLGDCVENGDQFLQEWQHATNAMYRLENPLTTLLTEGIPYGIAVGNHDQSPIANPDGTTTYYNQFFGEAHFGGRTYYGGHYGTNNDNHYELFSVSGLDFIVVHLEYDQTPDQSVLNWANALLQTYSDRRAIVVSHHIIGTGNPGSFGTQGQAIYNALKGNPNLHFMLSGHVLGEGRRTDVFNGNTVHTLMSDYQGRSGGSGWLRVMEFSPANNEVRVKTYSTTLQQFETDADSQFTLTYDMALPGTSFSPVQVNSSVPSGTTSVATWTGLSPATEYEWYVEATDGVNTSSSPSRRFTTASQATPVAVLTAPAGGTVFLEPADVLLEADATDADGSIIKVEFYEGSNFLGEDASAPYSFLWTAAPAGHYVLTAVAYDNDALSGASAPVDIFVNTPGNAAPVATMTSPLPGANYTAPADITMDVAASDSDGSIFKVEFYEGANKLGEDFSSPYAFTWNSVPAGNYSLSAVAVDQFGASGSTGPVNVTVDIPPQIAAITRGPYLQSGYESGVVLRWRTDVATGSRVRYGTNPANLDQQVSDAVLTLDHEVALTGLQADTVYFYELGTATHWFPGDAFDYFMTSPTPGAATPTRVWIIGDSGTGTDPGNAQNARNVRDAYANYANGSPTDVWLMLGDNAYNNGTDAEYQVAVFEMYPTMLQNTVLWPAIGNHDTAGSTSSTATFPYFDIFTLPTDGQAGGTPSGTERYYSFDHGNIHFICLDSMTSDRSPSGPMLTWLQSDLQSTTADWVIAFWHHPPYTKGSHNSDSETELVQMRQNALPILENAGVDLVLGGHSHSYERSFLLDGHYGTANSLTESMKKDGGNGRSDGTGAYTKSSGMVGNEGAVYVVAGSSGKISGGQLNHQAMYLSLNELGSVVLDVGVNPEGDHQMDAVFIDDAGAVRDYFTMIKQVPLPDPPAAPSGLVATTVSDLAIQLTWVDEASDEDGFKIERSLDGINFTEVQTVGANVVMVTDSGLTPLTTYYYQVRAYNTGGDSSYSNIASDTTDPSAPPAPPANVTAMALDNRVELTWEASAGADSYRVKRSTVSGGGTGYDVLGTVVTPLAFTDATAVNGTEYFYVVSAWNTVGEGADSMEVSATPQPPPAAPSGFNVLAATHDSLHLSWTDNAGNEDGFVLDRSSDGENFNQIAEIGADTTSYIDTGLVPLTSYTYRLRATNLSGDSAVVETSGVTASPPAPTGLTAAPGNGQVTLNWNFVTGASGYHIKRRTTSGSYSGFLAMDVPATTYLDSSVLNGTTYYYVVSAVISGVQGLDSAETGATPLAPPPAPTGLSIFGTTSTQIGLQWNDNAVTEDGYLVDRSTDGLSFLQIVQLPPDATNYTDTGLSPDTAFFYRVRAFNVGGNSAFAQTSASTLPLPPETPTGLVAVAGTGVVHLSWDPATGAATYEITRASVIDGTYDQIAYEVSDTFYDDVFVANGASYYYKVIAHNNGGVSSASEPAAAMTAWPPNAPTGLVATPGFGDYIDLVWVDNSDDEIGFKIEWSLDALNYQQITTSPVGPGVTVATHNGLEFGTTYYYRVSALGQYADSAPAETNATTIPLPPETPTGLAATPGNGFVDLTWNPSLNAETYEVSRRVEGDGEFTSVQAGIAGVSFRDSTVQNGLTYYYVVKAWNIAGSSADSTDVSVTLPLAPEAPSGLVAIPVSSSEVSLAWIDQSSIEDGYIVERSLDGNIWTALLSLPADTTGFLDTSLSSGTYYRYRVFSFNAFGSSPFSNEAMAAPYIDQVMTSEILVGGTQIGDVSLTQQSDDVYEVLTERESGGKPALRYSWLEHKWTTTVAPGAAVTLWVEAYKSNSPVDGDDFQFSWSTDDLSYTDLDPVVSQLADDDGHLVFDLPETLSGLLYIRVTDTDHTETQNALESVFIDHLFVRTDVNGLNAPPTPPDGLVATAGDGQVDLSWNASAGANSYRVLRSTTSGTGYTELAAGLGTPLYTDSAVVNDITYYYVVTAENAFGESGTSFEASATPMANPPPLPPENLLAQAGDGQIDLAWDASASAVSYRVWRSTTMGGDYAEVGAGVALTTYTDTTVQNGTIYFYVVTAVNGTGLESGYSNEANATPMASTAPNPPTQLEATVSGKKKIGLTWIQSDSPNVTVNNIYRSTTNDPGNPASWTKISISAATSFQDTGLQSGVQYYYYLTAENNVGEESDPTSVVSGIAR